MARNLVPATIAAAMLAFATAAVTAGGALDHPRWWRAAVSLAVLGGVMPMIMAINIRVVPVFARRDWPSLAWLRAQVVLTIAGAWTVYAGRMRAERSLVIVGSAAALAGGFASTRNIIRLFRRPPTRPEPPRPHPAQAAIDRVATRFTRMAGIYQLAGLAIGLEIELIQPETGRWELVWAHAMLVGYMLSMAAGVCYHVLSRWTGRPWRAARLIPWHVRIVTIGLPVMLAALATDRTGLFLVAGPLQAAAVLLFLGAIAPMLTGLPEPTRSAIIAAGLCLAAGVTLGASFAIEPSLGARLRLAHAELNLFGWTGLLISGVAYYLVPRFFGAPLRWPRLAVLQLSLLGGSVLISAASLARHAYGETSPVSFQWSQGLVALAFLLLAGQLLATMLGPAGARITLLPAGRAPLRS